MSTVLSTTATEAQIAATSTLRAARLAAGGALLAALLALLSSILTVQLSGSGETERSRAEFLRSQQQQAYTEVGKHERAVSLSELFYQVELTDGSSAEVQKQRKTYAKVLSELQTLRDDRPTIAIIGSTDTVRAYDSLVAVHGEKLNTMGEIQEYAATHDGAVPPTTDWDRQQTPITQAQDAWIESARKDLGVDE